MLDPSRPIQDGLPRVGFVGLGQMGQAMAARVAAAGFPLSVLDVRDGIAATFCADHGARPATSGADLAEGCDVVITMLPNGATVAEALTRARAGGRTLAEAAPPGAVVIDMSSSAPHETLELGTVLARHGVELIDAPVSGGVGRAVDGTLAIMAGGDEQLIARHAGLLRAMGTTLVRAGDLGSGHAAKALNNAVSAAGLLAASEALLVGKRFGIDPEVLLRVLNASTGRNNATENKISQYVFSRSFASGFALSLLAKDLRIAAELAERMGVGDAFTEASRSAVDDAEQWLGRPGDHTEVVAFLEHQAGTTLAGEHSPVPEQPAALADGKTA